MSGAQRLHGGGRKEEQLCSTAVFRRVFGCNDRQYCVKIGTWDSVIAEKLD